MDMRFSNSDCFYHAKKSLGIIETRREEIIQKSHKAMCIFIDKFVCESSLSPFLGLSYIVIFYN